MFGPAGLERSHRIQRIHRIHRVKRVHRFRATSRGFLLGLACFVTVAGCAATGEPPSRSGTASAIEQVDRRARLRAAAVRELESTPEVVRVLPPPPMLAAEGTTEFTGGRTVRSIAEAHLDPAIVRLEPPEAVSRPASVRAIRGYVRGRMQLSAGRPQEAIQPLESAVRDGGGDTALRALAVAFDEVGNVADALAIRRRLAARGSADDRDLRSLGRELARRRRSEEALAVIAARYLREVDRRPRLAADAVRDLMRAVEASEGASAASELRAAVLVEDEGRLLANLPAAVAAECLLLAGDDAAKRGRPIVADERWSAAALTGEIDSAVLRPRLVWSSASLGRDATVQEILLESSVVPTGVDREMFALLRDGGVELPELREALVERILAIPDDLAASTLLVSLDPKRAAEIIGRLDAAAVPAELRVALVDAAIPGGPSAGVVVAAGVVDSTRLLDVAVDRLISAPWSDQSLLDALLDERVVEGSTDTSLIRAELLRRYERPGLAADALAATGFPAEDQVRRVVRIRIAGDVADPAGVLAVADEPFDASIEAARIEGLLVAGEPELALAGATDLVARTPSSAECWAAFGEAAGRFRGRELDAAAAYARAIRLGDRRWSTRIGLARTVRRLEGEVAADSEIGMVVAMVAEEPAFRPLVEADRAIASGDLATASRLLDGMLENPEAREEVLVRLLGVWQATGRIANGRRRLESLLDLHPADPVLQDAVFALRQSDANRARLLESLRLESAVALSGHPRRRLELLLADRPEDDAERDRLAGIRLGHRPNTASRNIDALDRAIRMKDATAIDRLLSVVSRLDPSTLAPRQRRRLADVAAAVPDPRGGTIVDRVATWYRTTDTPVDVDVASAMVRTRGDEAARPVFEDLRPADAATFLDRDWRAVGLSLFDLDPTASAELLRFGLRAPDAETESGGGLPRAAIAVAMAAGGSADLVVGMLEAGTEAGIDWAAIYEAGASRWEILAAVSGDASLLGRLGLANALLEIAVADPEVDAPTINNLGFALLDGDAAARERASTLLDRAYEVDAGNPSVLDSLGWCRYLQGRNDAADPGGALALIGRSLRARAAAGRPLSSEVLLHYGDASWRAGRETDAVAAWSRITEETLRNETLARRLAAFAGFQRDVWGRVLVDPRSMHDRIDGRWERAAEARLSAIAEDRAPAVTPIWAEVGEGAQAASE
ncbi:MAG: hypothetical protein P8J88_05115 [Phycisphaerales bacterium]|nr:hypothetical protein [Phycisphaerales bacterium]